MLDNPRYEDIRKLCSKFGLSNGQVEYIMTEVPPCHAFFESLSISIPDLSLQGLRCTIEDKCKPPNKIIFTEIEEAISSKSISYCLDSELGVVVDGSKQWLHFLVTLANNLLPATPDQKPTWKTVASFHDYETKHIKAFESKNSVEESRPERFLSVLLAHDPLLPLSDFTKKLEEIGRMDASNLVKNWPNQTMVRQVISLLYHSVLKCMLLQFSTTAI